MFAQAEATAVGIFDVITEHRCATLVLMPASMRIDETLFFSHLTEIPKFVVHPSNIRIRVMSKALAIAVAAAASSTTVASRVLWCR
jgi:hypothetical protein